jgi:hypothetical protein
MLNGASMIATEPRRVVVELRPDQDEALERLAGRMGTGRAVADGGAAARDIELGRSGAQH